jgi:putative DNA methylase
MTPKKKLIEVALPLEAINTASAREKSIRHGHPSTLHLWWARRPLAAARAIIFAQMVDDPSSHPDRFPTEEAQDKERQRLFRLIEKLVLWENTNNEDLLNQARDEIRKSWRGTCSENRDHPRAAELFNPDKLPAFHDPFAGGGSLPLEAQRLGLEAYASDLNPVAVLINKAMIEIPPRFSGWPPVNPESLKEKTLFKKEWRGAQGLAEDVRYYGRWMRDEAEKRIGHHYPKVEITADIAKERPDLKKFIGQKLTVIAWIWARTVKSPNPAFSQVDVPLTTTFMLSNKAGKEVYIEPVIEDGSYRFTVRVGKPKQADVAKKGTKLSRGANFQCLMSGAPIASDYIRAEGKAGRMGTRMMAIVGAGDGERIYLAPSPEHEAAASKANPTWKPEGAFVEDARAFTPCIFGIREWQHLFTDRQLMALTTFSDMVGKAKEQIRHDALAAGMRDDIKNLHEGGTSARAYADALVTYLSFAVDYAANYWSTLATPAEGFIRGTFSMQALSMSWDFAEAPPFGSTSGNWMAAIDWSAKALSTLPALQFGTAQQADAARQSISTDKIVSTDPPYYDNVPYADLSDYFYVWLRNNMKSVFPDLNPTTLLDS